jgi:hypothetical protein
MPHLPQLTKTMHGASPPAAFHPPTPAPSAAHRPRMVGFIGGSNDFFIAVMDHRDWGGAFIV